MTRSMSNMSSEVGRKPHVDKCITCGMSKYSRQQLAQAKKDYQLKFIKLK